MSVDLKAVIQQALVDADRSFAATGNVMEALSWLSFAAKHGQPVPPCIAAWLSMGLDRYRSGTSQSMDAALGLAARGRPARRMLHDENKLQSALARMLVLHTFGATIPQAAALVARLGDFTQPTLADRYRRRGLGKMALAGRAEALRRLHPSEIEQTLAEYPDHGVEIEQAKDAIRAMYARGRI